jgi:hypothetical protein
MRVLTRLCFVLERPESSTDPAWAETGAPNVAMLSHARLFIHPSPLSAAASQQ